MKPVFFATLGQRPEAITVALDKLLLHHDYETIGIIHTDPIDSGISDALTRLRLVLEHDYPDLLIEYFEVVDADGCGLIDIETTSNAQTYYRYLIETFIPYREQRIPIHLLVAGGRKSMSIYATLAASLLFGIHDLVMTVLSPPTVIEARKFHVSTKASDEVQIVELPIQKSRLLPTSLADQNIDTLLNYRVDPRRDFLNALSPKETDLVELVKQHRNTGNKGLAKLLKKSDSTIEVQFTSIYSKLESYFDLELDPKKKRQALLDVLDGRI